MIGLGSSAQACHIAHMTTSRSKRPRDPLELAKLIGDIATGQAEDQTEKRPRSMMAELGRAGGLKGGKARAAKLSAEQRRAIAQKAAASRWRNDS